MRKIYLLYLLALLPMIFISCDADDDSSLANGTLPTIELGEFPEEGYNVVSYQGNHLKITPEIKTSYNDSQLTYSWYLVDNLKDNRVYNDRKKYEWELISNDRNLDYDVNLAPGSYYVYLEVKADNGYAVTQRVQLLASTDFSAGYYILKETADGHSELDIFRQDENKLIENLFAATTGEALQGEPLFLSMSYDNGYIDEETNETAGANFANIVTANGKLRCLRTSDLRCVMNNDNILYEQMESGVQPYMVVSGLMSNYLFTSEGVRSQYAYSMMGGSGLYGIAGGMGASKFVVSDTYAYCMGVWSEDSHTFYMVDYNGSPSPVADNASLLGNLNGWSCLACGYNRSIGNAVYLLENNSTKTRKLVYLNLSAFAGLSVDKVVDVDSSSHLAKGNIFTVSCSAAAFFYCVDGNKIYGYDLNGGEEQEILPSGLGSETISYFSDKYVSDVGYYLVVGTQSGNQYTLRFYEQLGGKPDGQPVYTVKGTGKVVSIKYTSTTMSGTDAKIQD